MKERLSQIFEQCRGCLVVVGVGTHSRWVSRLCKERGFTVIVANPRQVRLIAGGQRKKNRFDAQMLARLGQLDPDLLAAVQHRGVQAQQHRAMMQARDGLVRCRKPLIKLIRGLAKAMGVRLPSCGGEAFARQARAGIRDQPFHGMETLLDTIGQLGSDIGSMDKPIQGSDREHVSEAAQLQQVTGVAIVGNPVGTSVACRRSALVPAVP